MSAAPRFSAIIRAKDEARALRHCLELLHEQSGVPDGLELIVVDGGSQDDSRAVASGLGARVLEIAPRDFSYGRALNLGCAAARGSLLVPVSAHAFPPDAEWLERLGEPFADPRVACASGDLYGPNGRRLQARVEQDLALARARPEWGYSNAAGALRAELWRARHFREELVACEDKEWSLHWLARGHLCVVDPGFVVEHDHTHDRLDRIYARSRLEWAGLASFCELESYGARQLARDVIGDVRFYDSRLRALISPRRLARILGMYAGRRAASP